MAFPEELNNRWGGTRYHALTRVLTQTFGAKVHKVSLRADFTCPNRDGRVAVGGCIYCNNNGHTPRNFGSEMGIHEQMAQGIEAIRKRHKARKFIAYFQSYTNTYGSVEKLERLYRDALSFPEVVGLSVATRPDCLPDEVLDLLAHIAGRCYVTLEIGLESMYERTLAWVNRGHGVDAFVDAVNRGKQRGLQICVHLILGFPTETPAEVLATAPFLNRLQIDGVKLHNLHVIRHTALERLYRRGSFSLLSREAYVSLVVGFLERLSPGVVIHRLTGQTYRALTVAPDWSTEKFATLNEIHRQLAERDTWQGRAYDEFHKDVSMGGMR